MIDSTRRANSVGRPMRCREDDRGQERVEDRRGRVQHDVGAHGARCNTARSYSGRCEVACQWQGHPENGRLRCSVGDLTDLSVVGGDRSSVDDHTTLTVAVRLVHGHGGSGEPCDIECPKGVLGDGFDEDRHVVGAPIAADCASRPADTTPCDVDHYRKGAHRLRSADRFCHVLVVVTSPHTARA